MPNSDRGGAIISFGLDDWQTLHPQSAWCSMGIETRAVSSLHVGIIREGGTAFAPRIPAGDGNPGSTSNAARRLVVQIIILVVSRCQAPRPSDKNLANALDHDGTLCCPGSETEGVQQPETPEPTESRGHAPPISTLRYHRQPAPTRPPRSMTGEHLCHMSPNSPMPCKPTTTSHHTHRHRPLQVRLSQKRTKDIMIVGRRDKDTHQPQKHKLDAIQSA